MSGFQAGLEMNKCQLHTEMDDVDVCSRSDGSLGHGIYRQCPHSNPSGLTAVPQTSRLAVRP